MARPPLDPVSLEVCACGWAPELPVHLRVRRMRVDKDAAAVHKNIVKTMRDRKQAAAAVTE